MSGLALWQRPVLRRDDEKDRKATWLELFYDLVFVVIIAQLSHGLAADVSWHGVAAFALPFVPAWWLWIGGTIYADRFETEDIGHRLLTFLQMVPVAAMAVFVHHGLEHDSAGFALAYAAGRVLIIVMWVRGGWHNPEARPMTNMFAVGFTISVVLFLGSLLLPVPQRYWLWTVALVIDLLIPLTTIPYQKALPRFSTSRLPERFGLFTIIVLGETIVGVVSGLTEVHHLTWQTGLIGLLGMGLAFGLWWLYFDGISHMPPRGGLRSSLARNYLHLPLVLGITAVGAAVLGVVEHADHEVEEPVRWLLCGAASVVFGCLALLTLVVKRSSPQRGREVPVIGLLVAAGVTLALASVDAIHGAIALVGALLVVVLALVALDVWTRRERARG